MSWYAHTLLPTIESVFADVEPPASSQDAGMTLILGGYPTEGDYVKSLTPEAYERLVWDAHLRTIEIERPQVFLDNDDDFDEEEYYDK